MPLLRTGFRARGHRGGECESAARSPLANPVVAPHKRRAIWLGVAASLHRGVSTYTGTGDSDAMAQGLRISIAEGVSMVIRHGP